MEAEQENLNYKDLCVYCFDILTKTLTENKDDVSFPKEFEGVKLFYNFQKSYPLFVTWLKGEDKDLRGCIGTFAKEKLEKNLKRYTLLSAFKDDRFSPITKKELTSLSVSVSLLINFEIAENPYDWEVGKHGVEIEFEYKNRPYGATFLPEIASEEGWDQKITLLYLLQKSGYKGKLDAIIDKIKTTRYQSVKTHLTYEEFKKIKQI